MIPLTRRLLFVSLVTLVAVPAFSQGCSDAGFCSMGAMKPDQPFNKKIEFKLRSMELSFYRATTTLTPKVYVATMDFNFSLNSRNTIQIKLPYQFTDGNFGGASSISDISVCYTRNLKSTSDYDVNLSLGGKIPTNDSNLKVEDRSLPMYYQTSLGTYDFIAGLSVITRNWLLATGIQHPFNENNNQFKYSDYDAPVYPDPNYVREYALATKLKRGTDVMIRVERNFRFSRVNISVGLLPIWRVTKDEIESPAGSGKRVKVENTTGLALSGIATAGYSFNVRSGVKILVGRRIIHRETNPDGLTREFVTTLSYFYRF